MSNSELIRKYFSAYENKDRKTVESLLSNDFVFTSPYDHRINRETYFKRCWPYRPAPAFVHVRIRQLSAEPLPFSVTNEIGGLGQCKSFSPRLTRVSRAPAMY